MFIILNYSLKVFYHRPVVNDDGNYGNLNTLNANGDTIQLPDHYGKVQ